MQSTPPPVTSNNPNFIQLLDPNDSTKLSSLTNINKTSGLDLVRKTPTTPCPPMNSIPSTQYTPSVDEIEKEQLALAMLNSLCSWKEELEANNDPNVKNQIEERVQDILNPKKGDSTTLAAIHSLKHTAIVVKGLDIDLNTLNTEDKKQKANQKIKGALVDSVMNHQKEGIQKVNDGTFTGIENKGGIRGQLQAYHCQSIAIETISNLNESELNIVGTCLQTNTLPKEQNCTPNISRLIYATKVASIDSKLVDNIFDHVKQHNLAITSPRQDSPLHKTSKLDEYPESLLKSEHITKGNEIENLALDIEEDELEDL